MRRIVPLLLLPILATLAAFTVARAEDSGFTPAQRAEIVSILRHALATDPTILRDAVAALREDEAERKEAASRDALVQYQAALTADPADPQAGDPHGDVTVVEFYDLQCPYCRTMVPALAQLLHSDAHVRLVYKDIPVLGPGSQLGARAVLAARLQSADGYAKLQEAIMQGSRQISEDSLRADAARAGLDWPRLRHDMADPAIAARLQTNLDLARALGVEGTPVFVIGKRMVPGAVALAELQTAVSAARAGTAQ